MNRPRILDHRLARRGGDPRGRVWNSQPFGSGRVGPVEPRRVDDTAARDSLWIWLGTHARPDAFRPCDFGLPVRRITAASGIGTLDALPGGATPVERLIGQPDCGVGHDRAGHGVRHWLGPPGTRPAPVVRRGFRSRRLALSAPGVGPGGHSSISRPVDIRSPPHRLPGNLRRPGAVGALSSTGLRFFGRTRCLGNSALRATSNSCTSAMG